MHNPLAQELGMEAMTCPLPMPIPLTDWDPTYMSHE